MARPFRIGATGGLGCSERPKTITPTRRRDVPLSMCGWEVSVDDVLQRHGTPESSNLQHSRSYFGPAIKRWTLREVSMNGGMSGPLLT